ncbi:MAG: transposase family protein [Planctomycetaceae bacterium]|nr:transposase family protein [Planctomycetaceae bacterium]
MLAILQLAYDQLHQNGGKPPSLSVGDKLLITLQYYREYRTMEHIAVGYGCSKSSVHRSVV